MPVIIKLSLLWSHWDPVRNQSNKVAFIIWPSGNQTPQIDKAYMYTVAQDQ